MADGIAVGSPGELPFADRARARRRHRHGHRGVALPGPAALLERAKLVVEPAGVAAVAAAARRPGGVRAAGGRGAVRRQHRPAAAAAGAAARHDRGRALPVAAGAGARPARLAGRGCSPRWPSAGANVVEVEHVRTDPGLASTRSRSPCSSRPEGPSTADELLAALPGAGYRPSTPDLLLTRLGLAARHRASADAGRQPDVAGEPGADRRTAVRHPVDDDRPLTRAREPLMADDRDRRRGARQDASATCIALDGVDLTVRRGHRARPARPQRRRQDHGGAHPDHPAASPTPGGPASPGLDVVRDADAGARRDRPDRPVRRRRRVPDRLREPRDGRPALPPGQAEARVAGRRAAGALRPRPTPPTGRSKTYSGGMRRRLDIAGAPGRPPRVLFLDEPTTGLDPRSRLRHVGGHRRPRRRRDDDPAHHPVPRGGRPARRPHRRDRPRPGDRPRHRRRAEGAGRRPAAGVHVVGAERRRPRRAGAAPTVRSGEPTVEPHSRRLSVPVRGGTDVLAEALRRLRRRRRGGRSTSGCAAPTSTTCSSRSPATRPRTTTTPTPSRRGRRTVAGQDARASTPMTSLSALSRRPGRHPAQPDQGEAGPRPARLRDAVSRSCSCCCSATCSAARSTCRARQLPRVPDARHLRPDRASSGRRSPAPASPTTCRRA